MGGTLAAKVLQKVGGEHIAVCDYDQTKIAGFAKQGATALDAVALTQNSRFVVLGVKPQVIESVIKGIADYVGQDTVVISMAAGISIAAIKNMFGRDVPVIRIMPNTPASLGEGVILYAVDGAEKAVDDFKQGFALAGQIVALDESKIDAASAVSGCGPAFAYMFVEALADAGVECGLPYDLSLQFAAQTVLGAAKMVQKHGNPAALKAAVCSPGGTTIAGVHALEEKGFRAAAMDAVVSAYQRTLELKK